MIMDLLYIYLLILRKIDIFMILFALTKNEGSFCWSLLLCLLRLF